MKKFGKKLLALTLAGVLALNPMVALAADSTESPAEGELGGDGKIEGVVDKEIFVVELPTVTESDTTFDFILDPQGLIKETTGAAYTSKTFDDTAKGVYFNNTAEGAAKDYSGASDALVAINKGTVDVDVTLEATVDALSGDGYEIVMTDDKTFASDTNTSLYLALKSKVGSDEQEKAITTANDVSSAKIEASLDKAPDEAYEIKYADGAYKYQLTTAASAADYDGFASIEFSLEGACNTAETVDWSAAKDATPTVDVTWSLKEHEDNLTATKTAASTAAITVAVTQKVTGVKLTKFGSDAIDYNLTASQFSSTDSVLTIVASYAKGFTQNAEFTVTYEDGSTQALILTVTE